MICTSFDDFISDKDDPIWIANLSNGLSVYQDDHRPNVFPSSAWLRLKEYIEKNDDVHIVGMKLKFRSNEVVLPSNKFGYFWRHGIFAGLSKRNHHKFQDINLFIVGYLDQPDDNFISIEKWRVPELVIFEREQREIDSNVESSIICQQNLGHLLPMKFVHQHNT